MIIYTNLYKTSTRNYNVISDHFGLEHIEPLSYEDFCLSVTYDKTVTIPSAMLGKNHTEESKKLISIGHRGSKRTAETKKNISEAMLASPRARCKNQNAGLNPMFNKKHSDATKKKMSEKRKLRESPALGKTWKRSAIAGKKQSATVTGRKRFYKPDGSWTWMYPTKT